LREKGKSEEEIAAAFFVSVAVVRQRLRLASVSPQLLDVYAEDVEFLFDEPNAIEIGGDPAGMTRSMRARLDPDPVKLIDYSAS